ncbi:hypothetical protein H0H93_000351, partial [Arthromyces matolae]
WAIIPYDDSGPFAKQGDSGAIIVDGLGRFGGLLTGASGPAESPLPNITYATPFWWLWPLIKERFPGATLCPAAI